MKLADHRNSSASHLQKCCPRHVIKIFRRHEISRPIHLHAPGPERIATDGATLHTPAKQPLKRVGMCVREAGQQRLAGQPNNARPNRRGVGRDHALHDALPYQQSHVRPTLVMGIEQIRKKQGGRGLARLPHRSIVVALSLLPQPRTALVWHDRSGLPHKVRRNR